MQFMNLLISLIFFFKDENIEYGLLKLLLFAVVFMFVCFFANVIICPLSLGLWLSFGSSLMNGKGI